MFWFLAALGVFILILLLIGAHQRHQDIMYNQQMIINLLEDISTEIRGMATSEDSSISNDIDSLREELKEKNKEFISIASDILSNIQDVNRRIR